jgi:hypothetical protein
MAPQEAKDNHATTHARSDIGYRPNRGQWAGINNWRGDFATSSNPEQSNASWASERPHSGTSWSPQQAMGHNWCWYGKAACQCRFCFYIYFFIMYSYEAVHGSEENPGQSYATKRCVSISDFSFKMLTNFLTQIACLFSGFEKVMSSEWWRQEPNFRMCWLYWW